MSGAERDLRDAVGGSRHGGREPPSRRSSSSRIPATSTTAAGTTSRSGSTSTRRSSTWVGTVLGAVAAIAGAILLFIPGLNLIVVGILAVIVIANIAFQAFNSIAQVVDGQHVARRGHRQRGTRRPGRSLAQGAAIKMARHRHQGDCRHLPHAQLRRPRHRRHDPPCVHSLRSSGSAWSPPAPSATPLAVKTRRPRRIGFNTQAVSTIHAMASVQMLSGAQATGAMRPLITATVATATLGTATSSPSSRSLTRCSRTCPSVVAARRRLVTTAPTRPADLRIGRFFAWLAFVWMLAGLALLLIVPPIARLSSCTSDSRPAPRGRSRRCRGGGRCCGASRSSSLSWCAGRPAAGGLRRTAAAGRSSRACSPRRSGCADTRSSRPPPPWPDPEFEPTAADRLGYGAASVVALVGVAVATVCIRTTAPHITEALHRGIALGHDFWLLPAERRLRARYGGPPAPAAPLSAAARADRAARPSRARRWSYAALVLRGAVRASDRGRAP